MKIDRLLLVLTVWLVFLPAVYAKVQPAAARTELYYPLLQGKRIGLVANTASVADGMLTPDRLHRDGMNLVRLFSPEHGFRVSAAAGEKVGHSRDSVTGLPVISLYGDRKKPQPEDLAGIDVVLFDLQDVGVRFYTYISTLSLVMEACAEGGIPMIVLDRPNPNGFFVDGPVLQKEYSSYVGMHPVPVVYGMTIGEYALMVNGEGWLKAGVKCDLTVIPMADYVHNLSEELPAKPSPNLPNLNSVLLYPSLCFFEGTVVSVGRGTDMPFECFGHPDFQAREFFFIPEGKLRSGTAALYEGRRCYGKDLRKVLHSSPELKGKIHLEWLMEAFRMWGDKPGFFNDYFSKLSGNAELQKQIEQKWPVKKIRASWRPGIEKFMKIRGKYLLYS